MIAVSEFVYLVVVMKYVEKVENCVMQESQRYSKCIRKAEYECCVRVV